MGFTRADYHRELRKAKNDYVTQYKMAKGCAQCGYKEHTAALDLHHIIPRGEDFPSKRSWGNIGWDTIKEELKKCVVLCANCHRIVHWGDEE